MPARSLHARRTWDGASASSLRASAGQIGRCAPATEDLIGAGAILAQLPGSRSPETELAIAAFRHVEPNLLTTLRQCGSGKELIGRGFEEDVRLAAQLDVSDAAPLLIDGAYRHLEQGAAR